jgi:hypothetical protein
MLAIATLVGLTVPAAYAQKCADTACTDAAPSCCDNEEDGSCDGDDGCPCYLFGPSEPWALTDPEKNCRGIKIGGWIQSGYHNKAQQFFNYNNNPGQVELHQAWLYAEKATDGADGLDFGGRVDLLYGMDGADTQAFGNPFGSWDFVNGWDMGVVGAAGTYSWAMPQLYGEIAYDKWKTKFGHFYTPMGYEVVGATGNFFYSHSYTNYNIEPFTHTGILSTYTASDDLTLYTGWVLGWDSGFDQLNQGNAYIGGLTKKFGEKVTFTYTFMAGKLGSRNAPGSDNAGYNHSFVVVTTLTDKLTWVVNSDMISSDGFTFGAPGAGAVGVNNDGLSLVNYLFYKVNDCWSYGGRAEWFKLDGVSIYDVTAGVNYRPHANFVLRPEIRYEWSPGGLTSAGVTGTPVDTTIFGVDGVLSF